MAQESYGMFDDPQIIAHRKTLAKHAEKAMPSDVYEFTQWEMGSVHYLIFNAIEAAYKNAMHIEPDDLQNFLGYAIKACDVLVKHHESEETIYFPKLEPKINMAANIAQHQEFVTPLHDAISYLQSHLTTSHSETTSPPDAQPFSPATFRSYIDACLPPMMTHFIDELVTLDPATLRQTLDGDEKLLKEANKLVEENAMRASPFLAIPLSVYSLPKGCAFPPIPRVIKFMSGLFALKYWGEWKYAWRYRKWEANKSQKA